MSNETPDNEFEYGDFDSAPWYEKGHTPEGGSTQLIQGLVDWLETAERLGVPTVDTWGDLPDPDPDATTRAGSRRKRIISEELALVEDAGDGWNMIAGLGTAENPVPEIHAESVSTEDLVVGGQPSDSHREMVKTIDVSNSDEEIITFDPAVSEGELIKIEFTRIYLAPGAGSNIQMTVNGDDTLDYAYELSNGVEESEESEWTLSTGSSNGGFMGEMLIGIGAGRPGLSTNGVGARYGRLDNIEWGATESSVDDIQSLEIFDDEDEDGMRMRATVYRYEVGQ